MRDLTVDTLPTKASGVMAKVTGRRVHVVASGQGAETVVLEAALGSMSSQWAWVQQGIAQFARVLSYDRAGLGWSQPAPRPRDAGHIASELMALLEVSAEGAPYVIVGHSLGGLFARVFAARYPGKVAGLVLIDPTPLDLTLGWATRLSAALMIESLPLLARLSIQPLRAQMGPLGRDLPPAARDDLIGAYGSVAHLAALRDEYRAMDRTMAEARRAVLRQDLPVTVLSADLPAAPGQAVLVKRAQAEHQRFAAGFDGGRHRIIAGSSHLSLVTDPVHAHQVVEEVRRLTAAT